MLLQKIAKMFVVFTLALSFGLSMFSFSPAASVTTRAAYGSDIPCDEFKTPTKKEKCLSILKEKLEKQAQKALDKKVYEKYNDLLSEINNVYWEFWNITTYGWDYF
jgi:hypothetical protein